MNIGMLGPIYAPLRERLIMLDDFLVCADYSIIRIRFYSLFCVENEE